MLSNKQSTSKASITQALTAFHDVSKVHADDVFMFYVASHGSYDSDTDLYHMFTSDVLQLSRDRLLQTTITEEELRNLIGNIPAMKKLIVLDTCNSGAFARKGAAGFVSKRDAMQDQRIINTMRNRTGAAVFAASGTEQSALEGYEGHGVFSYFMLQGLKGAAARSNSKYVSTDDLKIYVEEQVPEAMEKKNWGKQSPNISTHQFGFPVAMMK